MRVGLGVTVLLKGLSHGGLDGIGQTSKELHHQLRSIPSLNILPVSFGRAGFDMFGLGNGFLFNRFAPLVACSVFTGSPFFGYRSLKRQIDIFHATDHYIPNLGDIPVVATIHDAIPLAHPEWVSLKYRLLISHLFKKSSQWASQIITVSEYSKSMICYYFDIPPERVVVIPNGVGAHWFDPLDQDALETLRSKYCISKRYVINVGTLQPRKNIVRLIKAFQMLPVSLLDEVDLVVVGRMGWGCNQTLEAMKSGIDIGTVRWLKYLPDDELMTLVKGASCLAFPSLAEGFGLPVVEAFAAGIPVITSNTTSLPEVAGDAALLVNPLDVGEISNALKLILEGVDLSNSLRDKGFNRARYYSWERSVFDTASVYKKLV